MAPGGAGRRGLSPVALSVGSGWAEPAQVGADPRAEGQGALACCLLR